MLEYLNTSLGDYVGEGNLLPEPAARQIFHSILHCVHFLHQKGLAHRDLKVENLMFVPDASQKLGTKLGKKTRRLSRVLTRSRSRSKSQETQEGAPQSTYYDNSSSSRSRGNSSGAGVGAGEDGGFGGRGESGGGGEGTAIPALKIIDFGFGKIQGQNLAWSSNTPCGTTRYMAPEMIQGRSYSQSVDMWSLGCILHFMLFGKLPFSKQQVKDGDVSEPRLGTTVRISRSAKDLLQRLLSSSKETRATASEALEHAWFGPPEAPGGEGQQELPRTRSGGGSLDGLQQGLARVSLSPGEALAGVLNRMREEDDAREEEQGGGSHGGSSNGHTHSGSGDSADGHGGHRMHRPSPISVFGKMDDKYQDKQLSILRAHLADQLGEL